ncbi:rhodanese-like domain-containing protein [Verrucomicrobiaceae bacterium E54]|nr:rhodanese-like domain-containing protein [Verrucomicrobiaceae bacterium E54]
MGLVSTAAMMMAAGTMPAEDIAYPVAKVSFKDFEGLVAEAGKHRADRLVDLDTFLKMSREPGVIILDTRSQFRFDRIHVKGAKHLNFSDFTQANLAEVIPTFETTVLIYCNNNFEGNQTDFASKIALPRPKGRVTPAEQFSVQERPIMMALNIPTYVNLYGYGYRKVYELHELVDVKDPRIIFEGSIVDKPDKPGVGK